MDVVSTPLDWNFWAQIGTAVGPVTAVGLFLWQRAADGRRRRADDLLRDAERKEERAAHAQELLDQQRFAQNVWDAQVQRERVRIAQDRLAEAAREIWPTIIAAEKSLGIFLRHSPTDTTDDPKYLMNLLRTANAANSAIWSRSLWLPDELLHQLLSAVSGIRLAAAEGFHSDADADVEDVLAKKVRIPLEELERRLRRAVGHDEGPMNEQWRTAQEMREIRREAIERLLADPELFTSTEEPVPKADDAAAQPEPSKTPSA